MGPLTGVKVLEFEAIGPAPFCGMMLADMGADVLLVDRAMDPGLGLERARWYDVMLRGRRSVTLDLKLATGAAAARALAAKADVVLEGFRPGVMERLGLGPAVMLEDNPSLVYGRMTGWGQDGPLAPRAGHDINYVARSGVLHALGRAGTVPLPPLNLVGDFGGGGMLLALGIACALFEAQRSGRGQVVDAAMVEGASLLATMFWGLAAGSKWNDVRGANILDGGAPWYDVYETQDHQFVAIGAIEPKFYAELLERMGLANEALPAQHERARWPELRQRFAQVFATRTRADWCALCEGSDACLSPVLSFVEAREDAHNMARRSHVTLGNIVQPAPAPRFSRTPSAARHAPPERGAQGAVALADWGFSRTEIEHLRAQGLGFVP
ncbi:MAG: CaiB/BaiF CoA-transferase family protein [Betaproteobacteria bacterium]